MSAGYQLVQSTHSIADFSHQHPQSFKDWKEQSNSIVCLSVQSEQELLHIYEKYKGSTPSSAFYEPDIDAWTSVCLLGTPPIRKKLSRLPLSLKNLTRDGYHEINKQNKTKTNEN